MAPETASGELLRQVGRSFGGAADESMALVAAKTVNWDVTLQLAREHRITPLLFIVLSKLKVAIPPDAQKKMEAEYRDNVLRCLMNAGELIALLKEFDRESIPAMPFKGIVLAASAYGELTARNAGDLDLMIHYRDLLRASELLKARGFVLTTESREDGTPAVPNYFEYRFERPQDGMVVELRWRHDLTSPRFQRDLGMEWVWPGRRTVALGSVEVPDISPEITLLLLCMHGSKHHWSRLLWICDVARLSARSIELNWSAAIREAKRTGLWCSLALGALLAHRVCGAAVPAAALRQFERDATACRLARHFDECLFSAPGSAPPGRVPYNVQLLSFRDKVSYFSLASFFRPNERDRAFLRLPKRFDFLYPLLRPLRLLLDRSPRI
jgi:hypothetical protein